MDVLARYRPTDEASAKEIAGLAVDALSKARLDQLQSKIRVAQTVGRNVQDVHDLISLGLQQGLVLMRGRPMDDLQPEDTHVSMRVDGVYISVPRNLVQQASITTPDEEL